MSQIHPKGFEAQQLAWGNFFLNSDGVVNRSKTSGPLIRDLHGEEA